MAEVAEWAISPTLAAELVVVATLAEAADEKEAPVILAQAAGLRP